VEYQLRHYEIRAGAMDAFVDAWLRGVYPLRQRFGFKFVGAWRVDGADEFVWILAYDGPDGFAEADRRYYASAERKAVDPDPAQFIERPMTRTMRSVLPA
jgi:NIPSNAP protein